MSPDDLHSQVRAFAEDLTRTLRAVLGDGTEELAASELEEHRFGVKAKDPGGYLLTRNGGEPFLRLRVRYWCEWDNTRHFVRVDRSEIKLFPAEGDTEPLIRYEYDSRMDDSVPSAHLQIHTNDPRIVATLGMAGKRSRRARRRAKGDGECKVSSLHLPLGGTRFRPALEDVLQMVVEEFGIDAENDWRRHLEDGREAWRRTQTKAVVRDAPEEAAHVLRKLGYCVAPPTDGIPDDRRDRLREP